MAFLKKIRNNILNKIQFDVAIVCNYYFYGICKRALPKIIRLC